MKLVLQPASGHEPKKHYRKTIETLRPLGEINEHLTSHLRERLRELHPEGEVRVWGAVPGPRNRASFRSMDPGDLVLFYRDGRFISMAPITLKAAGLDSLARKLWGEDADGNTWELVYFLGNLQDIDISYEDAWEIFRYGPSTMLRGLTVLDEHKSWKVINAFGLAGGSNNKIQKAAAGAAESAVEGTRLGGQGFASSAEVRKALEDYSMRCARRYFEAMGFDVEDRSANHPYDLFATKDGREVYVEVKGTQTSGEKIILTQGEVEHAQNPEHEMALYIQRNIEVERVDGDVSASGGKNHVVWPWDIEGKDLTPITLFYAP